MNDFAGLMHAMAPLALGAWLQSALLLGAGLMAARALRRHGAVAQVFVLRASLAACAFSVVLLFCNASLLRPMWIVALPVPSYSLQKVVATRVAVSELDAASDFAPASTREAQNRVMPNPATSTIAPDKKENSLSVTPHSSPNAPPNRNVAMQESAAVRTPRIPSTKPIAGARPNAKLMAARVTPWLGLAWLTGSCVLLLLMLANQAYVARLVRRSEPVEDATFRETLRLLCADASTRAPLLLQNREVNTPFLCGLWRPAIVLPLDATSWDGTLQRAVLLHETTHWRRRDLWWNFVARVGCALLWPQPLLWIVRRVLASAGEEVCDAAVLQSGVARASTRAACSLWRNGAPRENGEVRQV